MYSGPSGLAAVMAASSSACDRFSIRIDVRVTSDKRIVSSALATSVRYASAPNHSSSVTRYRSSTSWMAASMAGTTSVSRSF